MLALEIEHLLGVAFAAQGQDRGEPDWPPQPDRVFSALVAAWGGRGERPEERDALAWLETLAPPALSASSAHPRPAPITFVPPNDPSREEAVPARRRRQPRRFPAALPYDPCVHLVWSEAEAPAHTLEALNALARDTAYVGHSASLTRCLFRAEDRSVHPSRPPRRRVYPGRLAELERAHGAQRRPSPGSLVRPPARAEPAGPQTPFSPDWLVFEITKGSADLRATATLARLLRTAIMSGYQRSGQGDAIPRVVSGHEPDGSPAAAAHMAVVPLANVGFARSNGDLFGLAIVPPRSGEGAALLGDPGFHRAVAAVAAQGLHLGGTPLVLEPRDLGGAASLNPARYGAKARTWATLTPMVLDRHLKPVAGENGPGGSEARQAETEALIARACLNLGLEPVRDEAGRWAVTAHKHSTLVGAPSAAPSGRAPRHTGWRVPEHQRSRPLVHAVVRFAEPVWGPLILGAARFAGLGLCLPLDADDAR